MRRFVRLAIALAMLLSVTALTTAAARPAATTTDRPVEAIDWQPCNQRIAPGFDCAQVRVPLDHDNPRGPQITVAVSRLAAADQENKIGSIFLNPGGPGGSGLEFLWGAGPFLYSDEVRANFDLVGFDPRGINRSTPLNCYDSQEESFQIFPPFAFPVTDDEYALDEAIAVAFADQCDGIRMTDHMSTADVARDLDLLRQMVGDEQLNYAGYSYGTYLGQVYANLFPDNVRAVVIDAVLDPIAWTTGAAGEEDLPFTTRLGSHVGAMDTLNEFFRLCDEAGPAGCAFAPDSAERFDAIAASLLEEPAEIIDPDTGETFIFRYSDLIGSTLGPLYNSASWPFHAQFLALVEQLATPEELGLALRATTEVAGLSLVRGFGPYPNPEGFAGVACSDSVSPSDYAVWEAAGIEAETNDGYFGRLWTHAGSPCHAWQADQSDSYFGPFTAETANPVLVVSTLYDPATRYQGALTARDLLPNSSLLTVDGWGHATLFLSACADAAVSDYFLTGVPPADGTVCTQDFGPFDVPPAEAGEAGEAAERAERRTRVMKDMALRPGR